MFFFNHLVKCFWNEGIIIIFIFWWSMRDRNYQDKRTVWKKNKTTLRSDELVAGRVRNENQERKSMKTGRQWWTVNRVERILRRREDQLTVTFPVIKYYGGTTRPDVTISLSCKKAFAVSRSDLVTRAPDADETKIQSGGWSTVAEALWW